MERRYIVQSFFIVCYHVLECEYGEVQWKIGYHVDSQGKPVGKVGSFDTDA